METVTSGLCYLEDSTFLENIIVWFWNSLNVQSTDSSLELYDLVLYSILFSKQLSALVFEKKYIIQKKS